MNEPTCGTCRYFARERRGDSDFGGCLNADAHFDDLVGGLGMTHNRYMRLHYMHRSCPEFADCGRREES